MSDTTFAVTSHGECQSQKNGRNKKDALHHENSLKGVWGSASKDCFVFAAILRAVSYLCTFEADFMRNACIMQYSHSCGDTRAKAKNTLSKSTQTVPWR